MCYPLPGPRCSASAATRLARARHAALVYFEEQRSGELDWEVYEKLAAAADEAEREYNITPAGIKAVERAIAERPDSEMYQQRLANLRAERASRIAAAKALDIGDHHAAKKHAHQPARPPIQYSRTELSREGARLEASLLSSPDVQTLLAESETWVTQLSAEEIDVLRWYSQGGYEEINGGLSVPDWEGRKDPAGHSKRAASPEVIATLDSALAKADASKAAIVYRRHFFYNFSSEGDLFDRSTFEEQAARFPVGSVYKPGFYMSTSLNPANIGMGGEGGFMVRLEIKTRRGASLVGVAQQGTNEQEFLLPRDASYRVVANDRRLTVVDGAAEQEVRVIQLEELP